MLAETIFAFLAAFIAATLIPGFQRKIQARIQQRRGPPLLTPGFWSSVKSMYKYAVTPDSPSPFMYHLMLWMGLASISAIFLLSLPQYWTVLGFSSLLGFAGFLKLEEVTYLFMGSLSKSVMSKSMPYPDTVSGAKLGGVRAYFEDVAAVRALKMITLGSFPFYLSLTIPFLHAGSLSTSAVLSSKPVIYTLSGLIGAFVYVLGYNILSNNRPFDIIKPKVDIIEGPVMEYMGKARGLYFLVQGLIFFVLSSLFVSLYLGVPFDVSDLGTLTLHLVLSMLLPAVAAVLKAYSPVFTFKQIMPVSYALTFMGVLALALNTVGV